MKLTAKTTTVTPIRLVSNSSVLSIFNQDGKADLLDEELIETHGRDVEYGADQEGVHIFHDLIDELALVHFVSSRGRVEHGQDRLVQQL